jgi:serine/threonine protein kinase
MSYNAWTEVRELGAGHFGQVLLVNRRVIAGATATQAGALKTLKDATNEAQRIAAANEIVKLAELDHPNLSRFIESGSTNGLPWFVMNFVEGESLLKRIETKGPLSQNEWILFVESMLDALHYLRQKNISHLDIKPDNIIRSESGKYTLVDFGLSSKTFAPSTPIHNLSWSSPEQMGVISAPESPASDLFSFAMSAYFALTGSRPYSAAEYAAELQLRPADLSKAEDSIRIWLQPALSLNPASRPSAKVLLEELRHILEGGAVVAAEIENPLTWQEFEQNMLFKLSSSATFELTFDARQKGQWQFERDSDQLEGQRFYLRPANENTLISPSDRNRLIALHWRNSGRHTRELQVEITDTGGDNVLAARLIRDTLVRGLSLSIENLTFD